MRRLLILTGKLEAGHLGPAIADAAPAGITVATASSIDELSRSCSIETDGLRLISFCSPVIVPASILTSLRLEPYNIHPGSPDYPGIYPEAFAVYDGAKRFASTAHVMTEKVDAGAIVRTDWFDVPEGWERKELAERVFASALELFFEVVLHCIQTDAPLPRSTELWSGTRRTRKDYREKCLSTGDTDEDARRARAFAPDYPLENT